MKAVLIRDDGGFALQIPDSGRAAILFLEWIASENKRANHVHAISEGLNHFLIRLNGGGELYERAVKYINNNL